MLAMLIVLGCSSPPPETPRAEASPAPAVPPAPSPPKVETWRVTEKKDEMSGAVTVFVATDGDREVSDWLNRKTTPTLGIRCHDGSVEIIFGTHGPTEPEIGLYEQATVTLKVGEGKPWDVVAGQSTDNEALFLPKERKLLAQMVDADKLTVRWVPFHSSPATVAFDLTDADEPIRKVLAACPAKT